MIVKKVLKKASQRFKNQFLIDQPDLEAEILLSFTMGKSRGWLLANLDKKISTLQGKKLAELVERRLKGEPIAYLTGRKEFYGLDFIVNKDVLIPRPETELLVDSALEFLKNKEKAKIIDLGTGSGCLAIAILKNLPIKNQVKIQASDYSLKALAVAKKNAQRHQVNIKFTYSDLFKKITGRFDLIVANLPYINNREAKIIASLLYHPPISLDGGKKGIELNQRLIKESKNYLKKNGRIILEIAPKQVVSLKKTAKTAYPQARVEIKKDLNKKDRELIITPKS